MQISNRVKRNISLILSIVGIVCIVSRIWNVIIAPTSGRAWFELFGMLLLTYLCFDNYLIYRRRVKKGIKFGNVILCTACVLTFVCCGSHITDSGNGKILSAKQSAFLKDTISSYISTCPGKIGVALILNNTDTVAVNDTPVYPMMSVYKMHQAIALCKVFDDNALSLDSIINVDRDSLNQNTWSPMLKEHSESEISISVKELLRYALIKSDNNASNLLFNKFVDTASTDSILATFIPRSSFLIRHTEEEMSQNHVKAYDNYTSPSGAAMLINDIFTDSLISRDKQNFIIKSLGECATGNDRISSALIGNPDIKIAHKTGSGYTENGILIAHNDVAYIQLPNSVAYSLAIFVKDFAGDESDASKVMSHISAIVYDMLKDI